jgi:hypothetical protein
MVRTPPPTSPLERHFAHCDMLSMEPTGSHMFVFFPILQVGFVNGAIYEAQHGDACESRVAKPYVFCLRLSILFTH